MREDLAHKVLTRRPDLCLRGSDALRRGRCHRDHGPAHRRRLAAGNYLAERVRTLCVAPRIQNVIGHETGCLSEDRPETTLHVPCRFAHSITTWFQRVPPYRSVHGSLLSPLHTLNLKKTRRLIGRTMSGSSRASHHTTKGTCWPRSFLSR